MIDFQEPSVYGWNWAYDIYKYKRKKTNIREENWENFDST